MGRPPWTGKQYADLIYALGEYEASVVSLEVRLQEDYRSPPALQAPMTSRDMLRPADGQEISNGPPENETALIEALKRQGATYLAYDFTRSFAIFTRDFGDLQQSLPGISQATFPSVADSKSMKAIDAAVYKLLQRPPTRHVCDEILNGPSALTIVPTMKYYLGPSAALGKASLGSAIANVSRNGIATFARIGDTYYASLCVALVSRYLGGAPVTLTRSGWWIDDVAVGKTLIPVNQRGYMWVNQRPPDAFPRFSVSDIIERKVKISDLKGKIVLVGEMIDKPDLTYAGPRSFVEVSASAVEDILSGQILRDKPSWEILLELVLVTSVYLWLLAWCVTRPKAAALWTVGFALLAAAGLVVFDIFSLALRGVVYTSIAWVGGSALTYSVAAFVVISRRRYERNRIRTAFEHYLDPKIIDAVIADPAGLELGGAKRTLTILFADIVDFTGKAEDLGPEATVETLNVFMSAMMEVVIKSGGVIDKIVGDSIMAFWGAPARVENPARRAIDCGLEMLGQLRRLRERDLRFADFHMGVGIATGEAVVGNLGGERRFDYSVVGDTVNLAARLESLTRRFKVSLLVNEQSHLEAGGEYVARDLGLIRVKGKTQPAAIWEIVGRESEVLDHSYYKSFSEALDAARETRWTDALEQLHQLAEAKPEDVAVNLYLAILGSRENLQREDLILEFCTK
jgi:adenylate cyclase